MTFKAWLLKQLGCNDEQLTAQLAAKQDVVDIQRQSLLDDKKTIDNLNASMDKLYKQYKNLQDSIKKPDVPQSFGTITAREEIELLSTVCTSINITDDVLRITSIEEAQRYVERSMVQYKSWVAQDYDCDNFSASLYGYWSDSLESFAFGMARSKGHQFNIMIDKDKKIWIIEPQTARIMTVEEARKASTPDGLNYFPITYIWM
jgi:hypothetical protein